MWSNEVLGLKAIADTSDTFTLEQLSYPHFFANDPKIFLPMVAYNQSATAAYSSVVVGSASVPNLANPEILTTALQALLDTLKIRTTIKSEDARPLTEQAIKRVSDIEKMLGATVGDENAMRKLWAAMFTDLKNYQEKVNSILTDLNSSNYKEEKYRFDGANLGTILPCPSMGGWPSLQAPVDPVSKQSMEKFVAPVYWAAQEMRLGRVAQCMK